MEQGEIEETTKRPSSGRVSINKIPFQRSGSSLEIIPPDDNGDKQVTSGATKTTTSRPPSRPSSRKSLQRTSSIENQTQPDRPTSSGKKSVPLNRPPSRPSSRKSLQRTSSSENVRQTQSAGSSGKKPAAAVVNGDVKKVMGESDGRSSSADARIERSESPKKQVFLPSVRRNYEQHGMPKDMALETKLRESLSSPVEQAAFQSGLRDGNRGGDENQSNVASKENIDALLQRLTMRVDGSKLENEQQERKGSGKRKQNPVPSSSAPATSSAENDSYYISHGKEASQNEENTAVNPVKDPVVPSATDPYYTSPGADVNNEDKAESSSEAHAKDESDESSSDDEDSDEEDEGNKAPIELLGEFMEAVMGEEWEDAEKLCKMVLIYEADNAEATQFQPLIEEMLRREREEQLFSGSEEDSSEDDSDDDDDDDDDDDEDSDEDSSSSESESEETNKSKEARGSRDRESEKQDRESTMMKEMKRAESQLR